MPTVLTVRIQRSVAVDTADSVVIVLEAPEEPSLWKMIDAVEPVLIFTRPGIVIVRVWLLVSRYESVFVGSALTVTVMFVWWDTAIIRAALRWTASSSDTDRSSAMRTFTMATR